MDKINENIENIEEECEKIDCHPIINVFKRIYKLIRHLVECFKFKSE